jgi:uncharacterized protein YabE (DUF348 family)
VAAVLVLTGTVLVLRAVAIKNVSICIDGSEPMVVSTGAFRVGTALTRAGVTLFEGDVVTPSLQTRLREGHVIMVQRAFPVQVVVDGQQLGLRTTGASVHELLQLAGVVVGEDDKVTPPLATPVMAEGQIQVIRVTYQYTTVDEVIRFRTTRRADPGMDVGTTRVVRQGKDGTLRRKLKLTYEDGELVSRTTVGTEVIVAAVDSIINVGSRPIPHTVRTSSGKLLQYTSVKTLLATAYTPKDGAGHGITFTGVKATRVIVAVDPKVIPLGTRLYIPGYGEAVAADTGGAIRGLRIDLCMETRREALQFGRRTVKAYILTGK